MRKKIKGYDSGGFLEGMTDMMSTVSKGRDAIDKFKAGRKASGSASSSAGDGDGGSTVAQKDPQDTATQKSNAAPRGSKDSTADTTGFSKGGKVRMVRPAAPASARSKYMKGRH